MVAVTETWFSEDIDDSLASIRGYNFFRKDRPNRRGGDVCIYMSGLFRMPTAEPISKMSISNACGFGCASFVYLDPFVA
jgi:hypothetical protein